MDLSTLIFPSILLGIMLIFLAVFMIVTKKQHNKASINVKDKDTKSNSKTSNNTVKKNENEVPKEDVFKFMEFDRILDNMVVQNDGTKFTMAIKCKGINYDLMSDMEQIAVEEGFITFLNTLRYPIQLYVQAQNIDLKSAISTYKKNASGIQEEYETINKQYVDLLDQFDAKEKDIKEIEEKRNRVLNVYEYATDIINYVEKLSLNKNLLQRNFYVLVSYYSSEITAASNFTKDEIVNICYNELLTRAQSIISGLSSCSVSGTILSSNELADLLYTAYNRDDKGLLSVREAIESGFYRLYSTSEDVFYKKQEKLLEEISDAAELKALEALKKSIEEGTYISKAAEKLNVVEQVSKTAAEIVNHEDVPQQIKDRAKEILVDDYVQNKNKIMEEAAIERQRITGNSINKGEKDNSSVVNINENENKKEEELKSNDSFDDVNGGVREEEQLDNRLGYDDSISNRNSNTSEQTSNSSDEDDLII